MSAVKAAVKGYWNNVRKIGQIVEPDATRISKDVRNFYGEIPHDYEIPALLRNPPIVHRLWDAYQAGNLRNMAGRFRELLAGPTPEPASLNGHPDHFERLLSIEAKLDEVICLTKDLDANITDTLLNARRQIGARIIS